MSFGISMCAPAGLLCYCYPMLNVLYLGHPFSAKDVPVTLIYAPSVLRGGHFFWNSPTKPCVYFVYSHGLYLVGTF